MRTYILQDTITVRGKGSTTVTQSETDWLDLEPHEDAILWLDVQETTPGAGGTLTLSVQTSPTKDEAFFNAATIYTVNIAGLSGVQTPQKVLLSAATTSLARYLRWQLTSASDPFDATFRLVVSVNVPVA